MIVICNKRTINNFLYRTFISSRTLNKKIRIKEISSILKKYHRNSKKIEKVFDEFIKGEQIRSLAENYIKSYRQNNCINENIFKLYKGANYEL